MASLQETVHAALRAVTSTTGSYEGDWHAYADHHSIADGNVDGRRLALAQVVDATIGTASAAHNYFLLNPGSITA